MIPNVIKKERQRLGSFPEEIWDYFYFSKQK